MSTSSKIVVDRSVYLGDATKGDPVPVFRDEASDAETWPEGAVFQVVFPQERYTELVLSRGEVWFRDRFYATDGWPLDFPAELKDLAEKVRYQLQTYPWMWMYWRDAWPSIRRLPSILGSSRCQGAILHAAVSRLGSPPPR